MVESSEEPESEIPVCGYRLEEGYRDTVKLDLLKERPLRPTQGSSNRVYKEGENKKGSTKIASQRQEL